VRAVPRDLTADVAPEITEGRLSRQWASLERRLPGVRVGGFSMLRSAALVVPALCLFLWLGTTHWTQRDRALSSGAVIESADAPFTVQLRDGSSLELAAQSQLRVLRDQPSGVKVEIGTGRVSFDVKHAEKRSFEVIAGVVSVRVVGTQFHVVKAARREGMEIEVAVKRGVVEVQRSDRSGDVRRLAAGETWSVWVAAEPVAPPTPPVAPPTPPVAPFAPPLAAATRAPVAEQEPAEVVPNVDAAPLAQTTRSAGKRSVESAATLSASHSDGRMSIEGVRALFLRANVARRAGRMQDAASAYAELLKRFPRDSRAGVSAFELGRVRMDALGDPKGAAVAFAEALRVSRKAEFREDALARLAMAADATGEREVCRRARARYLTEYSSGVHVASLTSLCGGQER
jgi:transmembrane sensor